MAAAAPAVAAAVAPSSRPQRRRPHHDRGGGTLITTAAVAPSSRPRPHRHCPHGRSSIVTAVAAPALSLLCASRFFFLLVKNICKIPRLVVANTKDLFCETHHDPWWVHGYSMGNTGTPMGTWVWVSVGMGMGRPKIPTGICMHLPM